MKMHGRQCLVIFILLYEISLNVSGNFAIRWTTTPYGSVAYEDGDCPTGRALQSYGEIMPDLTDLFKRLLRMGDIVADIGYKISVSHHGLDICVNGDI